MRFRYLVPATHAPMRTKGRQRGANPRGSKPKRLMHRAGFSFVELIVVLAIIVTLASLGAPALSRSRQRAKLLECTNNLRNVNLAMLQAADDLGRFPACGNFGKVGMHHSWVLNLLPYLDQSPLYTKWNQDAGLGYPGNQTLAQTHIPVLTCPIDRSVDIEGGNLSYVVNGGVGFTAQIGGIHDCPIDPQGRKLDLNGNGQTCVTAGTVEGDPSDKDLFFKMGLFFNETWKWDISVRHHRLDSVVDGLSNTILLAENVRVGFDPADPNVNNWATSNPYRTSFYIGNPCPSAACLPGSIDYRQANSGTAAINSGLGAAEGTSTAPNSFHEGGVNMAFGDGRVLFINEKLDGNVYAALVSPQGMELDDTELKQMIPSDSQY